MRLNFTNPLAIGQLIAGEVVEKFDDTPYLRKLLKKHGHGEAIFSDHGQKDHGIGKSHIFLIIDVTPSNETVGLTDLE